MVHRENTSDRQDALDNNVPYAESLPDTGFLRLPSIIGPDSRRIPVSKSTWWAGVKSGRFPLPVKLGPRITAWRVEDIRRLIEEAGLMEPMERLFVQRVGISAEDAKRVLAKLAVSGRLPEPVRIAHLVASALAIKGAFADP